MSEWLEDFIGDLESGSWAERQRPHMADQETCEQIAKELRESAPTGRPEAPLDPLEHQIAQWAARRNFYWNFARTPVNATEQRLYDRACELDAVVKEAEALRAALRAHPEPAPQLKALLTALKRVTDGMDRAGGDGYGMPECPWCRCQYGDRSDDRADHLPDCELALARQVIADVESGIAAGRPETEGQ